MVLQCLVIFPTFKSPADDEGFSSFFDVHKKRGANCGATDQVNPPKQHTIFRYIDTKNRLLGCVCFLKALPVLAFPTSGRNWTRTSDLIDVNDAL